MKLERRDTQGVIALALAGELTVDAYPAMKEAFKALLDGADPVRIVLNLAEATMVGSSAIGALVALSREVAARRGKLALAEPSSLFVQVLELLKLADFFMIFDSEAKAVERLAART